MCDFNIILLQDERRYHDDSGVLVYTALFALHNYGFIPVKVVMHTINEAEIDREALLNEAAAYAHQIRWHAYGRCDMDVT